MGVIGVSGDRMLAGANALRRGVRPAGEVDPRSIFTSWAKSKSSPNAPSTAST